MPYENSMNVLSSVRDIASLAYGSGAFEGAKGGEGYMGAFVDSTTGQVRVVKMLTHRSEYGAVKKAGGEESFAAAHEALRESTQTLKDTLLKIAEKHGNAKVIDQVKNLVDGKPLLSRKIVAQVVNVLTQDVDAYEFSWKDAAKQAKTMKDTTLDSVMDENSRIDRNEQTIGDRFKAMGAELDAEIKDTVATSLADSVTKIRAGRFDQGWRSAFREVAGAMSDRLNGIFRNTSFLNTVDVNAIRLNDTEAMIYTPSVKVFHQVLRSTVADEIEKHGKFPLDDTQKMRIMSRAFKKAFIISHVKAAADKMFDNLAEKFPTTEMHKNREAAIDRARARLNDVSNLIQGYEVHFGFKALADDQVNPSGNLSVLGTGLARVVISCDVLSYGEVTDAFGENGPEDRTDVKPSLCGADSIGGAIGELYETFDKAGYSDGKKVIVKQLNNFVTWFQPGTNAEALDVGMSDKSTFATAINEALFNVQ